VMQLKFKFDKCLMHRRQRSVLEIDSIHLLIRRRTDETEDVKSEK
jgi:hypothetical protein